MNFNEKLENLLKQNEKFCDANNELLKQKVKSYALEFDEDLIKALLECKDTKEHFFKNISNATIFDYRKFIDFIDDKNFLLDSYTKFSNKVGLTISNKHIKQIDDVVLTFPFKDCVLEGGQSKEDENKKEIFFNETLAKDEINRLLDKKVITNATKYYYENNEIQETQDIKFTRDKEINKARGLAEDTITDNLIIKGNNLLALHTLKSNFAGKVKLIYIDPPYYFNETKSKDSFQYNSNFKLSSWLTFMKNRLEIAKELLADNGAIFISLNNDGQHYLRILLDEIFLSENHVSDIVWQGLDTVKNDTKYFSDNHEYIFCYAKNKSLLKIKGVKRTIEQEKVYKNHDNDSRGRYLLTPIHAKSGSDNGYYSYKFENGYIWESPIGTFPRFSKSTLEKLEKDNRIYFSKKENSTPQRKTFLNEVSSYVKLTSFWDYNFAGSTRQSNKELSNLIGKGKFSNPKPTKLIKIIIDALCNKNDIVMDFFGGSATTAHAILDINKEQNKNIQFILVEQMDYIKNITKERIKKVISTNKQSEFIYLELDKYNQKFIDDISVATEDTILNVYNDITEKGFLNYDVELKKINEHFEEFKAFNLEQQKEFLISMLNKNQLYKNLSEIDDKDLKVTDKIKELNKSFYNLTDKE